MKVISLVDNHRLPGRKDLRAERGLSLCVFTDEQQILFDTGISGAFHANAQRLNVDVTQVSHVILSHHHYDHGGGLATFINANSQAKIYLRSSKPGTLYLNLFRLFWRQVGLDKILFQQYPERFVFIDEFTEIASGVFILTGIEERHPRPKGNRHLFIQSEGSRRLDDFEHELLLVIKEKEGLVVFTGCAHHGILNMLDTILRRFPDQPIKAVFGGFHLIDVPFINSMAGSKGEVEELGRAILGYPVEKLYTGHCTGDKAYRILKKVISDKLEYFATGCQVEV